MFQSRYQQFCVFELLLCFFQGKLGLEEVVGFKLIIQFCMKINQTTRKKWQELNFNTRL